VETQADVNDYQWELLPNTLWRYKCKICGAQRKDIYECDEHQLDPGCCGEVIERIKKRQELRDND
jgi:hypothetical protein